jgi:hypothetical protein
MQNELKEIAAQQKSANTSQYWILQVTSQKNTNYDHELVEEVRTTLGRHLEVINFQSSNYWFSLKGSKDKLENLMNSKLWFKRENLMPDLIIKAAK